MTFRPALPLSGVAGSNFLQRTYDRQLQTFAETPQNQNDRAYFEQALSEPISVDDFLSDRRLLRISLTAFGLAGEETKGGFVRRAFESALDSDDSFLQRINNPDYTRFTNVVRPDAEGNIQLNSAQIQDILTNFERETFEAAVGEIDTDLRLDLNFRSDIDQLVGDNASDSAKAFRLLGSVPVRTLLEGALNLPTEFSQLDVERQAEDLQDRLQTTFGISELSELANPEVIDRVTSRYLAIQSALQGPNSNTPGFAALSLLTGVGSNASANLFLSRFI